MSSTVDGKTFRTAMGTFATGVTVVVAAHNEDVHAMTANAVTSVSLDPPLLLVCVDHRAKMLQMIRAAQAFSVNILSKEQEPLSRHFANQPLDEVPEVKFQRGDSSPDSSPILEGSLASLTCTVTDEVEAGDHTIFIGQVEHIQMEDGEPLCFFKGKYRELA